LNGALETRWKAREEKHLYANVLSENNIMKYDYLSLNPLFLQPRRLRLGLEAEANNFGVNPVYGVHSLPASDAPKGA